MKILHVMALTLVCTAAVMGCDKKDDAEGPAVMPTTEGDAVLDANTAVAPGGMPGEQVKAEDSAAAQAAAAMAAKAEASAKAAAAEREGAVAGLQKKVDELGVKVDALKLKVTPPASRAKAPFKTKVLAMVSRLQEVRNDIKAAGAATEADFAAAKAKAEKALADVEQSFAGLSSAPHAAGHHKHK